MSARDHKKPQPGPDPAPELEDLADMAKRLAAEVGQLIERNIDLYKQELALKQFQIDANLRAALRAASEPEPEPTPEISHDPEPAAPRESRQRAPRVYTPRTSGSTVADLKGLVQIMEALIRIAKSASQPAGGKGEVKYMEETPAERHLLHRIMMGEDVPDEECPWMDEYKGPKNHRYSREI
jgi:hypothetical protein